MFFLNFQMLLGKEIYQKTVYERTSDSTIQEKTSEYALTHIETPKWKYVYRMETQNTSTLLEEYYKETR